MQSYGHGTWNHMRPPSGRLAIRLVEQLACHGLGRPSTSIINPMHGSCRTLRSPPATLYLGKLRPFSPIRTLFKGTPEPEMADRGPVSCTSSARAILRASALLSIKDDRLEDGTHRL